MTKSLIIITKHCPNFTNLNFSPHLPPPPNLLMYQSSTRAHCVPKIPVQTQVVPRCLLCRPIFTLDVGAFPRKRKRGNGDAGKVQGERRVLSRS